MPHNITGTHVAKLYQEFTYNSNNAEVDVVTSATAGSCFESGFGYTYNKGERIDCTYLEKRLVEGGGGQKMKKLFKMGDTRETTNQSHWQLISLTVLRIAIGWHFLYEGLLKVTSPDWSASYYLYNSTGPFASIFKSMALSPIVLGLTDILNQWGLVIIGISLMNGFISRWACLGGMVLLALYYLANPLFIGLGDTSISEGYYLIVNNNLIEFIALWILFQFRDSKVYGIDYFFSLVTDKEWGKNVKVPKI